MIQQELDLLVTGRFLNNVVVVKHHNDGRLERS